MIPDEDESAEESLEEIVVTAKRRPSYSLSSLLLSLKSLWESADPKSKHEYCRANCTAEFKMHESARHDKFLDSDTECKLEADPNDAINCMIGTQGMDVGFKYGN